MTAFFKTSAFLAIGLAVAVPLLGFFFPDLQMFPQWDMFRRPIPICKVHSIERKISTGWEVIPRAELYPRGRERTPLRIVYPWFSGSDFQRLYCRSDWEAIRANLSCSGDHAWIPKVVEALCN